MVKIGKDSEEEREREKVQIEINKDRQKELGERRNTGRRIKPENVDCKDECQTLLA